MRRPWRYGSAPRPGPGSLAVRGDAAAGRPSRRAVALGLAALLLLAGCAHRVRTLPSVADGSPAAPRAATSRSADAVGPYNRGVEALAQRRLEAAEAAFGEALDRDPGCDDARYNLALVWMKRGFYDRAEPVLRKLVAVRPGDADVAFALGSSLFHRERFGEAADAFRRLLTLAPDHRAGAFGFARSLQAAGRRDDAVAAWQAYLRLDATSPWAETARKALRELAR